VQDHGGPILTGSLDNQHERVRVTEALKKSGDFVVHSLRHTYGPVSVTVRKPTSRKWLMGR